MEDSIILNIFDIKTKIQNISAENIEILENLKPDFINFSHLYLKDNKYNIYLTGEFHENICTFYTDKIFVKRSINIYDFMQIINKSNGLFVSYKTPSIILNGKNKDIYLNFIEKQKNYSDNMCSICLDICLECNNYSQKLICGHVFHKNCLKLYFKTKKTTCPLCISEVIEEKKVSLFYTNPVKGCVYSCIGLVTGTICIIPVLALIIGHVVTLPFIKNVEFEREDENFDI